MVSTDCPNSKNSFQKNNDNARLATHDPIGLSIHADDAKRGAH